MTQLSKAEARLVARIMGHHGIEITIRGRRFSITTQPNHGRRWKIWWY